jgi:hypothetical protein
MTTVVIRSTGKTSDEVTGKARNEMRQVQTHTWAPGTSPKLKSLQDLSIRVNPEMTEEVVHHASLWVNGGLHLRLHMCKVIHLMLESSDPFHCALSLVNPITDLLLRRGIPVRVPGRDGGSVSEARLGGNRERDSNYHPHSDPSRHPQTQCPTGAPEGEPRRGSS